MKIAKIDVTKIDKTFLFKGAKGTYLDLVLIPNRDGTDQYGNDGMVKQGISKEAREAGKDGAILGNYKTIERKAKQEAPKAQASKILPTDDDVPF